MFRSVGTQSEVDYVLNSIRYIIQFKELTMGKEKKGKNENFFTKHWKDIVSLSLTTLSVIIGTWAFVKSCNNENKIEEADYKIASVDHRPIIRIHSPLLINLKPIIDTNGNSRKQTETDVLEVKLNLRLTIKLQFKNIGNSKAKILGYLLTDTITDRPIIKDHIKNNARKKRNLIDSIFVKYNYHELAVNDSSCVSFSRTLQFIKDNTFVIHFIIYYENELGQRYDTYYWLKGQLKDFGIRPLSDSIIQHQDVVLFIDENNYSSVYSIKESEENLNYLEELRSDRP